VDRRRFLLTSLAGALAAPLPAEAQPAGKVYRIGRLEFWGVGVGAIDKWTNALEQGLHELGYVNGRNIIIEHRFADGKPDRLPDLAAELAQLNVDVIVTSINTAIAAAQKAAGRIPIVMVLATNPVSAGFVANLARPGGNITGLTFDVTAETSGKRLGLLSEALPGVPRFAVIARPRSDTSPSASGWLANLKATEDAARALGVRLQLFEVRAPDDFEKAFATMKPERVGGVLVFGETVPLTTVPHVVDLAMRHRMPSMSTFREFAEVGGLMSYGPSIFDSYRRAATYVDRILKGAQPADLPVEQPTKFELVINLKTAKALGLTISPSLLLRADQIIE
jgi:putative ABC transport system substrate-binding protein